MGIDVDDIDLRSLLRVNLLMRRTRLVRGREADGGFLLAHGSNDSGPVAAVITEGVRAELTVPLAETKL